MTLKEFFIAALAEFEADVTMRAEGYTGRFLFHTLGLCNALDCVAEIKRIKYHDTVYEAARLELSRHRPANSCSYWWPVRMDEATQEESIAPRRALLNKIIGEL